MKPWNSLSPIEKIDSLTKVLTRAGSDPRFRKELLNPSFAKAAVEAEAAAVFDQKMTIRVLPNQAAAEREIVLLLPQLIEGADMPRKADDYWLCTYTPYADTVPSPEKNTSGRTSSPVAGAKKNEVQVPRRNTVASNPRPPSSQVTRSTRRWGALDPAEKIDSLTNVLTRAGSDPQFRKLCLDPVSAKVAIQEAADVIFDDDIVVRILPDQKSAEKEIVLLLPQLIEDAEIPHKADDYWLCTYWPYVDESSTRTNTSACSDASIR